MAPCKALGTCFKLETRSELQAAILVTVSIPCCIQLAVHGRGFADSCLWSLQSLQQRRQRSLYGITSDLLRDQQPLNRQHRDTVDLCPASRRLTLYRPFLEYTSLLATFEDAKQNTKCLENALACMNARCISCLRTEHQAVERGIAHAELDVCSRSCMERLDDRARRRCHRRLHVSPQLLEPLHGQLCQQCPLVWEVLVRSCMADIQTPCDLAQCELPAPLFGQQFQSRFDDRSAKVSVVVRTRCCFFHIESRLLHMCRGCFCHHRSLNAWRPDNKRSAGAPSAHQPHGEQMHIANAPIKLPKET